MKFNQLLEVRQYEHEGIQVSVKIDYARRVISVVAPDENFANKSFTFAGRGTPYIASWHRILDAIKLATSEAHRDLSQYEKENPTLVERILAGEVVK
jgi:hypothetical protein